MSTITELDWHWDFLCGSISGIVNCLSGYVFDTLKVKVQMNPNTSMSGYLSQMWKQGTLIKLFDGMYYPMVTVPIVNAVVFGTYEFYKKITGKNTLSFLDGIQNGAFAGFANTFVVGPVQLVKCRMQVDNAKFKNSKDCFRYIIREQGVKGLFRGLFATFLREIPAYSAQFATYQILKDYLTNSSGDVLTFTQGCFVGALAGINCWIFSYPQDIIKTKLQVEPIDTYKRHKIIPDGGFFDCGKQIYQKAGLRGFFYGIQPCIIRAIVANAFGIAAYERAKHFLEHEELD